MDTNIRNKMKTNSALFYMRLFLYFLLPTLIGAMSHVLATIIAQPPKIIILYSRFISFIIIAPIIYFILRYEKLSCNPVLKLNPKIGILLALIIALFFIFIIQVLQIELYFENLDYLEDTFFYKFKKPWNNYDSTFSTLLLISKSVFVPIEEEFVFTFIIFQLLLRKLKLRDAMLITAILFGLMHLPYSFFPQFFVSLMHCYLFYKTRNIFIPIILHAGYNVAAYTLVVYRFDFSIHVLVYFLISVLTIGLIMYLVKRIVKTLN